MDAFERTCNDLRDRPRRFLVTGVAGFIGSHLLEKLLALGQDVAGLDNFSTGRRQNLADVRRSVGEQAWARFSLIEGDIADPDAAARAVEGADAVLHQAALGSVPRSIADPMRTHRSNIDGFLTMLIAARDAAVGRFVYASSSSVYGDHPDLPKVEAQTGRPLSPYATTKVVDELYAEVFARTYGTPVIGLRYFNVFGPRQDPDGPYAAVIPRWIGELLAGTRPTIHGDGATTRDFCFVDNAVQANLLAATTANEEALNQAYNVAVGERTSLNELFRRIRDGLAARTGKAGLAGVEPVYDDFRPGDVAHSLADIGKAERLLGYRPAFTLPEGLDATLDDVVARLDRAAG
jgi:UDP-N-acetylglucosamine 4-epimerase